MNRVVPKKFSKTAKKFLFLKKILHLMRLTPSGADLDHWWCWFQSSSGRDGTSGARPWWPGSGAPGSAGLPGLACEVEPLKSGLASSATSTRTSTLAAVADRKWTKIGLPQRRSIPEVAVLDGGVSFLRWGLPSDVAACGTPDQRRSGTRERTRVGFFGSSPCWPICNASNGVDQRLNTIPT